MLTRPDLEEFYQHLTSTRQLDRPLYHLLDLFDKWREVPVDKLPQFHKPIIKPYIKPEGTKPEGINPEDTDPNGSIHNQTAPT